MRLRRAGITLTLAQALTQTLTKTRTLALALARTLARTLTPTLTPTLTLTYDFDVQACIGADCRSCDAHISTCKGTTHLDKDSNVKAMDIEDCMDEVPSSS